MSRILFIKSIKSYLQILWEKFLSLSNKEFYVLIIFITSISTYVYRDFLTFKNLYIYTDIGNDTFTQHWPYRVYLYENIVNGHIPFWSFKVGIGTNMAEINNSILLDPFNLILVLMNSNYSLYILPYIAVLKILLAGIFFYLYLSTFPLSKYSILLGSLLYSFSGYSVLWGQNFYYGTLVIYIPLVLYSFEIWLKKSKMLLFPLMIGLIGIWSPYYLYILAIFLILYALFRYFMETHFRFQSFLSFFLKTAGLYLLGIGLSAVAFLPSLYHICQSPRVSGQEGEFLPLRQPLLSLATPLEYLSIFFRLFSNDFIGSGNEYRGWLNYYESPQIYCGLLTLIVIPQIFLFLNKRARIIYLLLACWLLSVLVFPNFRLLMNGFAKNFAGIIYYREGVFFVSVFLLFIGIHAISFLDKKAVNVKLLILTIAGIILLLFATIWGFKASNIIEFSILIRVISFLTVYGFFLYIFKYNEYKTVSRIILLLIVAVELAEFSYISVNKRIVLKTDYLNSRQGYFDHTKEAIDYLKSIDNSFYRMDKSFQSVFLSDALFQGYNGTESYYSFNQKSYLEFLKTMNVPLYNPESLSYINGFNNRPFLQTLTGIKYHLSKNSNISLPRYKYLQTFGDIHLFKNESYLPLGFTYDKYITSRDFKSLSDKEKETVLLKAFVVEDDEYELNSYNGIKHEKFINEANHTYSELPDKNIITANINVLKNSFPAHLSFEALNNDPMIFLQLNNITKFSDTLLSVEISSEKSTLGQIFWRKEDDEFSEDRSFRFAIKGGHKNYKIDLSYINADILRLDIGTEPGKYEIKNLRFIKTKNPISEYHEDINKLREGSLNLVFFQEDSIKGNIKLDKKKLLFFSIPYDKGWSVKVDGKITNPKKVSIGFMGVLLEKGIHTVELKYTPPYFTAGLYITLLSIIFYLALFYSRKKRLTDMN